MGLVDNKADQLHFIRVRLKGADLDERKATQPGGPS
jgi:hypothetical protein